jgi:hypothetical protein
VLSWLAVADRSLIADCGTSLSYGLRLFSRQCHRSYGASNHVPGPQSSLPHIPERNQERTTSMEHFGTYEDLTGNPGRRLGEEEHAHRRDLVCVRASNRSKNTRFPDSP